MSLVVTGTDTEVGKTVISGLLMLRYAAYRPIYWKPLATGGDDDRDVGHLRAWLGAAEDVCDETYRFPTPASPHLAARLASSRIDPVRLDQAWRALQGRGRPVVIEGVGGALVPLTDDGPLLADWLATLEVPCLVVSRSTLGTINHTLLTLEALRGRGLRPVGVVMNGPRDPENRRAIEHFGAVPVVAEVDEIDPLDEAGMRLAAAEFDHDGHLAPWFSTRLEAEHG